MTTSHECVICFTPVDGSSVIDVGGGWSASIPAGRAPLLGWVTLHPVAHRASPDELAPSEADHLGGLIRRGSGFLRAYTGASRVYVANWAEATPHVHFHLIPRPAELDTELRGARIFSLMLDPSATSGGDGSTVQEQIAVLQHLGDALRSKDAA